MIKKSSLLLFSLMLSSVASSADIFYVGSQGIQSVIALIGVIEPGDAKKLAVEYKKVKYPHFVNLALISPGGNVNEAMKIGDFLEKHNINAAIPELPLNGKLVKAECSSSCVLVLAGANSKEVRGDIGIYRPYLTDLGVDKNQVKNALNYYEKSIKVYLNKKGIPSSLVDDMFSTPPEKIRYLSTAEISQYRLDKPNFIKAEQDDIRAAKSLGITRQEYMKRKARMQSECWGKEHRAMIICINRTTGSNFKIYEEE